MRLHCQVFSALLIAGIPLACMAQSNATLTIDQAALTVTADNNTKVYGDANPALTGTLTGVQNGDPVTPTYTTTATGSSPVGTYAIVAGVDATPAVLANYTVNATNGKLTVTKRDVTITFGANDKVYDGSRGARITGAAPANSITGDDLAVDYSQATATFGDKNVGEDKSVTADASGFALTGKDSGNYTIKTVSPTTANITPLGITGSFTAGNKVYDGNVTANVLTRSLTGVLTNDTVSLTGGTATFADKNVDTGKTVTLTGAGLSGTDAGNYTILNAQPTTTADITPRPVTITANNATMILGAPLPNFTGQTDGNVVQGETLNLTFATTATSASPAGTYDIVPSVAADSVDVAKNYAITPVNGTLSILYARDGFLQPVNDTAHQVGPISVFNAGQTIPLKFQLKNASGQVVQATVAPQSLAPVSLGKSNLAVNETATATAATSGSDYVWDGTQYQYNWKTTKSMAGSYWQVGALLNDGTTQTVIISLR